MSNIFLETWFKYAPCLRHFVTMCDYVQRNKFRCYNIFRAYGSVASVKNIGNSIPEYNKGKIFQPFFTTKPTGQGTGLGLSLSYDIVKAHGGELKVETKEGEGSGFLITLPTVSER
jgi:nitrogen-specific signal transduction histidine kinase